MGAAQAAAAALGAGGWQATELLLAVRTGMAAGAAAGRAGATTDTDTGGKTIDG
jgi:hypothetical protein